MLPAAGLVQQDGSVFRHVRPEVDRDVDNLDPHRKGKSQVSLESRADRNQ